MWSAGFITNGAQQLDYRTHIVHQHVDKLDKLIDIFALASECSPVHRILPDNLEDFGDVKADVDCDDSQVTDRCDEGSIHTLLIELGMTSSRFNIDIDAHESWHETVHCQFVDIDGISKSPEATVVVRSGVVEDDFHNLTLLQTERQ